MGRGNAHVQPRCSESCQCPLLVDTEQDRGVGWGGVAHWCPPPGSQYRSLWTLGTRTPLHPVFTLTMLAVLQCNQLSVKIYFTDVFPCPGGQQLFAVRFASLHTAEDKAVVK